MSLRVTVSVDGQQSLPLRPDFPSLGSSQKKTAPRMSRVIELRSLEALEAFRFVWHRLWQETRRADFFLTYEWFAAYWRHFGHDKQMRVLLVESEGETVGIVPLARIERRTSLGTIRTLTYPLDDWGGFYGPVGGHRAAALMSALRHVVDSPRDWDILDLRWIDGRRTDGLRTPAAMRQVGMHPISQPWMEYPLIETAGGWDAWLRGRPAERRREIERQLRRLRERHDVRYVRHRPGGRGCRDADPRWDLFHACVAVAEKSWQGTQDAGTTLAHKPTREFLRDLHVSAAQLGCLDVNVLFFDDQPVAYAYNYVQEGRVIGLRMGYDPDRRSDGPGTALMRLMVEDSCRRGDAEIDLGPGRTRFKDYWATQVAVSYRYTYYAESLRGRLLRLRRWWNDRLYSREDILARRSA